MSKEKSQNTSSIVSKVWAFCQPLRDDGVGYGDYREQLTYSLFLKMADLDNLPDPDVLAVDIIENIESGLEGFRRVLASLK